MFPSDPPSQVLRLAGQEAQDLRQAAQDLHLLLARRSRRRVRPAQLLQKLHRGGCGLLHVQIAHLRQLDDRRVRDHTDEGIHPFPRGLKLRQDGGDVFLDEQQVRHDDVGAADRLARPCQRGGVLGPFGGGVDRHLEPRKILGQRRCDPRGGACGMRIERDHDKAIDPVALIGRSHPRGRVGVIAHNGPWPRRACRRKSA